MRILVLQFVPAVRQQPVPRFEPQLGILLALLERRGHALALEGLAQFDLARVKAALARHLPQLIYADVSAVCADAARRTFEHLEKREFLPIVAGGEYATVEPAACLSLPGVHAAAVGEPDASLVTYFERIKDPAGAQVVSGVWLRDERGLAQPAPPPLVEDLNSLPFPNRALFGYDEHVRRTGEIELAVGRGCPQRCTYCLQPRVAELYAGAGTWVRRRAPANVLAEIAQLRERYGGARLVRFRDHAFALDAAWLGAFLPLYRQKCGLPFVCHVRANTGTEAVVQQLAAAGAAQLEVEVISGSDFIRNDVFEMDVSNEQLRATFAAARRAGVQTRAIVYLGSPYESEASLAETRNLLLELRPDVADVRPYHPWPGTAARELCQEQGWLSPRAEEQYHQDRTGGDLPACRPEIVANFVRRLRSELPTRVGAPWWRRWVERSRQTLGQVLQRRV